jgi:hypothetical protein
MNKDKTNIIVAIVLILISILGIPGDIKIFVYVAAALVILIPSLRDLQKEYKTKLENEFNDTFVENRPIERNGERKEEKTSSHIADA